MKICLKHLRNGRVHPLLGGSYRDRAKKKELATMKAKLGRSCTGGRRGREASVLGYLRNGRVYRPPCLLHRGGHCRVGIYQRQLGYQLEQPMQRTQR
jgi:hypothetical protein